MIYIMKSSKLCKKKINSYVLVHIGTGIIYSTICICQIEISCWQW